MRKSFLTYIISLYATFSLISCGEDRTYQLEEKTAHNHWIIDMMREEYLWADSLHDYEPSWKDYFSKPEDFLTKVSKHVKMGDDWSFLTIDTLASDPFAKGHFNHINSYGFDFVLMSDPTGLTTKQYARVTTIYPGSPAERAGLMRNDFISTFDGYKLSNKNTTKLEKGLSKTLEVSRITANETEISWGETRNVRLTESECVADIPYPSTNIIRYGSKRIGYIMSSRLTDADTLATILTNLQTSGISDLVLDLRLCNQGDLKAAQTLASSIVPASFANTVFARTIYNNKNSDKNESLHFLPVSFSLELSRIYIIISPITQGPAEWLIHNLQTTLGAENVVTIGQKTRGQNVMTTEIGYAHHIHLNPAVAYVCNALGEPIKGPLEPTIEIDEFTYAELEPYGSPSEVLFRAALYEIQK